MTTPRILYDNRFGDGTPVASTTASGDFSVLNLIAWRPYRFWKPTALPATVTIDCGSARSADYLLVYAHNLFSGACTVEVRGSTDNFAASDVLVHSFTPAADTNFVRTFTAASFRYWRARFTGTVVPTIAILAIGSRLDLDGTLTFDDFDPLARSVVGITHKNENGQPMGKIVDFVEAEQTITMQRTTWTWLRSTWLPAWNAHLRANPCAFQWDAGVDVEPLLVQLDDNMSAPHFADYGAANLSFSYRAVLP